MANNVRNDSKTQIGHDLANFISIFVSPPTIAIVATISFSLWSPIGLGSLSWPLSILLCFLLFAFFPYLPVLYFYRKNVVDLYVSKKEARTPFFIMAIASYLFAIIIFFSTNTKIMFVLALGFTIVSIILMVINLFWKVSTHCAGVTGPIVAVIFVFGINVLPLFLIILLVCWSRIKLENHTIPQTLVGTLIALTVGVIEYVVLFPLY